MPAAYSAPVGCGLCLASPDNPAVGNGVGMAVRSPPGHDARLSAWVTIRMSNCPVAEASKTPAVVVGAVASGSAAAIVL